MTGRIIVGLRVCPYCGKVAADSYQEITHMQEAHKDIIAARLRTIGEER